MLLPCVFTRRQEHLNKRYLPVRNNCKTRTQSLRSTYGQTYSYKWCSATPRHNRPPRNTPATPGTDYCNLLQHHGYQSGMQEDVKAAVVVWGIRPQKGQNPVLTIRMAGHPLPQMDGSHSKHSHLFTQTKGKSTTNILENCALLGYYAASSGNLLSTFRYTWTLGMGGSSGTWGRDRQVVSKRR